MSDIEALLRALTSAITAEPHRGHPQSTLTRCRAGLMQLTERVNSMINGRRRLAGSVTGIVTPVYIASGVYVHAVRVEAFSAAVTPGTLYYVDSADTFVLHIGGRTLTGNVGDIGDTAYRTWECRYGQQCDRRDQCSYYHPPETCGGNDRRNYLQSAWIHTPAHSHRAGTRTVGSRSTLPEDLAAADREARRLCTDQAMHGLLLALAVVE